ncbi:MAG TPA: CRISPR-associated protein Cas4 [Microscillaceae bacterium]|nr:CRISPR-associated protein Cas4 [Microscillaceae bacterium]
MKTSITPTLVNLYHVCQREMWLHAHGIRMEHTSEVVYEGKLIGETTYERRSDRYTELDLGIAKIDFYDAKNRIVHEVKKSDKVEVAHIAQTKYYLYLLYQQGIRGTKGVIEYPKSRTTKEVQLTSDDLVKIPQLLKIIEQIIASEQCPKRITKHQCQVCSYFDFCWIEEAASA